MAFDYRDKIEYNRGIHHIRNYMDDDIVLFRNPKVRRDVKHKRMKNNSYNEVTTKEIDGNKRYRDDYPAAVVLCCVNENKLKEGELKVPQLYYGESANESNSKPYNNSRLLNAFGTIGGVWSKCKSGSCKNKIGNCAEQHAAEELLNKNETCNLYDIVFSTAFRPRTDGVVPYCENCMKLFF